MTLLNDKSKGSQTVLAQEGCGSLELEPDEMS